MSHTRTLALYLALIGATAGSALTDEPVDFARDVRPILSNACFQCHGPDAGQRKAKLRLDVKEGAFALIEGVAPFVPGNPDDSEALRRIESDDETELMPPRKSGKSLTKQQIEIIRRWVAEGAKWSRHWSFEPPIRPAIPTVKNQSWVRNPIDAFIARRLETEKLPPSPPADRVTWLRRLSLDLVGLPPTPHEVDAFLADASPSAFEKQVDRLLASPHYGERWGRHWLDAARYADSDGYEKDKSRQVWFYRDWVIGALNRDLPYDEFIVDQIAGDQLPSAGQDALVATGFLRNSMINEEGGIDPEQFRMEAMFDRMEAIGKSVLGLTIGCAQCHNHKFDPLTQEEYYRMFAFLNNAHEANVAVYTPDQQMQRGEIFRKTREIEADLQHRNPDWREKMSAWETSVHWNQPDWQILRPEVDEISTGGQKYILAADGSFLAEGYAPTKHKVKLTAKTDLKEIRALRLELLTDPNLPMGGPGRSIWGTAALTQFDVEAAPADKSSGFVKLKIAAATTDLNPPETPLDPIYDDKSGKKRVTGPVAFAIDDNGETAWGTDAGPGRRNQARNAVFVFDKPVLNPSGTVLVIYLTQNHGGWNSDDNQNHNLGRFRLSATSAADAKADPVPANVRSQLSTPPDKRTPAQTAAIFSCFRTTVADWKHENDRIDDLWRGHPESSSQLAMLSRELPRDTFLLERGNFLKHGKQVRPGVPEFLHALPSDAPPTRLTFAHWLVDRRSPTTARAIVNRVWQTYFGSGLVATSEELGSQGSTPTHPDLLDWLAVEFMESGWSTKHLHRLIAGSATYRQSSRVSSELATRDPANLLLARGPRFRVEGEIVRDIALAASGLLASKLGGPSVFPPAPAFLFQPPASYGPKIWIEDHGQDRYRRALYTFRYRSVPYPALQTFDAPNGDFSCVRRTRSNTPLQALTALNEPLFVECARALARRAIVEAGSCDRDRLVYAFRLCVARMPSDAEAAELLALLERQQQRFEKEGSKPLEFVSNAAKQTADMPAGVKPAQLAAWTAVARVLLNLDETMTKE